MFFNRNQSRSIWIAACLTLLAHQTVTNGLARADENVVNNSSPVMVEDGQDNFLILNEDEVKANSKLLSLLSSASKEDVEEIVDNNPHMREQIITRIKGAVEQRQREKQATKASSAQKHEFGSVKANEGQSAGQLMVQDSGSPLGLPKPNAKYDMKIDDDEDLDDDEQVDEQQVARWREQLRKNALKVFRVGKGLRDRIATLTQRRTTSNTTTATATNKKKRKKQRTWPHFHYKISTN